MRAATDISANIWLGLQMDYNMQTARHDSKLFIWKSSPHYKEKCNFIFHFIENRNCERLRPLAVRPFFNKC